MTSVENRRPPDRTPGLTPGLDPHLRPRPAPDPARRPVQERGRRLPFTLDEVQAAVRALQRGEFRGQSFMGPTGPRPQPVCGVASGTGEEPPTWSPSAGEWVVAVVGSAGSTGASTLSLSLSLASARSTDRHSGHPGRDTHPSGAVRVVECCSANASGLAAASQAELGLHPSGWRQGTRDGVLIERSSRVVASVGDLPAPTPVDQGTRLTVLDVGWDTAHLMRTQCWLASAVLAADQVVVTATATIPGMRRLEATLQLLADALADDPEASMSRPTDRRGEGAAGLPAPLARVWVAVRGPRRRRWPRGVERAGGPIVSRVLAAGRLVEIPDDRNLAVQGLDSRPLPPSMLAAVERLLPGPRPVHTTPPADTRPHRREEEHLDPTGQQTLFDGPA